MTILQHNRRINKIYSSMRTITDHQIMTRTLKERLHFAQKVMYQECEERFKVRQGLIK